MQFPSQVRRGRKQRTPVSGGGSSAFFEDDFSAGNFTKAENGFQWGGSQYTSVIDTATVGLPLNPSGSGKVAQFNYNVSNNAEQRFVLDNAGSGYDKIFVRYYAFLPAGSEGGTVGPAWERLGGSGNNNKVIRFYDTTDLGPSTLRIGASTYGGAGTDSQSETVFLETGGPSFYNSPGEFQAGRYIWGNPALRGAWQKIEWEIWMNTVTASGWNTGGNGILRMYADDVLRLETTTGSLGPAGSRLKGGYLMGAANGAYLNSGTKMYIADFAVSATGRV